MERICYVHAGTHKTGTTSVQAFLAANRAPLARRDVLVPHAGCVTGELGAHHNVAWELRRDERFRTEYGGVDALVDELRASDAPVACISSEDFELLVHVPGALVRLREAIERSGRRARVVIYLRSQTSYCESVYAEIVKHGFRTAFAEYVEDVLRLGRFEWGPYPGPPFDYARLLDTFADAFGRDAILARRYDADAADAVLPTTFAALLTGHPSAEAEYEIPPRLNGALAFGGVLRALGVADPPVDASLPFTPLTAHQALRIGLRFAFSNADVARRYHATVAPVTVREIGRAVGAFAAPRWSRALQTARAALADSLGAGSHPERRPRGRPVRGYTDAAPEAFGKAS
ncbi:MAG: hypothetical protein JOZ86_03495 [Candidatus Eremiobacteraeota bacterium]|nr:hypothetical protein [Candidatus Eremiobacteraeota bacterium]